MNIKFVGIFVCIMLIITVFPATGTEKIVEKEEISCGLSPKLNNNLNLKQNQINNPVDITLKGKTAYGYLAYPLIKLVSFDLEVPGTQNFIADPTSSDFISGCTWVDGIWWGCEYSVSGNSNIWTIDHKTGEMECIGPSGSSECLNGLAYYEYNNTMYAAGANNLFTINMDTGEASLVGPYGEGLLMIGIAFDSLGNLYGECIQTDSLYSIDRKTGEATLIGSFSGIDISYAQDMAIDKDTDICYLAAFTISPVYEGALYTCDLNNGATTKVGSFGINVTEITGFAIPYSYGETVSLPVLNYTNFKGGLFKISVDLKNLGSKSISDVNWSMEKKGGFLLFPEDNSYGVINIDAGEYETINVKPVIGFGPSTVVFRYSYTTKPLKSDCELYIEGKQEWKNFGLLILNVPIPNQPPKKWVKIDTDDVKYFAPQRIDPYVQLIYRGIETWHNVKVVLNQKSSPEDIKYQALCKFIDGKGSLTECHVTKDLIRSGVAHWEVELVGDEIDEWT